MKRKVLWFAGLAVGMLAAALILMVTVYALPVNRMKSHVAESDEVFNFEGLYPELMPGYKGSKLDNYTDSLMYASAIHPGSGHPLKDAMLVARYEYHETNMAQSLNDYANDVHIKDDIRYEITYPRYWHGYLVILKPLLLFLNVTEIRLLNMILQIALLVILFYLVDKKLGGEDI